jgi:hypothetical protein
MVFLSISLFLCQSYVWPITINVQLYSEPLWDGVNLFRSQVVSIFYIWSIKKKEKKKKKEEKI